MFLHQKKKIVSYYDRHINRIRRIHASAMINIFHHKEINQRDCRPVLSSASRSQPVLPSRPFLTPLHSFLSFPHPSTLISFVIPSTSFLPSSTLYSFLTPFQSHSCPRSCLTLTTLPHPLENSFLSCLLSIPDYINLLEPSLLR